MIIYKHKNIIEIKESELVKFIFEKFNDFIYQSIKIPKSYRSIYNYENFPGVIGDLDLIFVDYKKPQYSIEIEFKKIKIKSRDNLSESINKLKGLKKSISQIENRLKTGFHKVYLGVIIVKDCSDEIANNIFIKKPSQASLYRIENNKYLKIMNRKAGIILFQFIQPTERSFNECASLTIEIIREAGHQKQTLALTENISQLLCRTL